MSLGIQYRLIKYTKENKGINRFERTVEGGGTMEGIIDYCQILRLCFG